MTDPAVVADLAPTGVLRASINLGNPVLAQGTSDEPAGVTVDLARDNTTDVSLTNVSGEVALRIPAPANAKIHANTTSGDVSSAFDELRVGGTWGAKQLTGTLGNGAGKVKITTVSGSVALLRRPAPEDDTPKALDFSKEDEA